MLGITFGSKHSYTDWGVFLENTEISPPLPKRYLVDVPARNGQLDLTAELTPTIRYQQRTLKYTFRVKAGDWDDLISQIYGDVHGKTMNVVSDLDLSWHWHGCVTVDSFASNKRTGVLVITVDCDPFKLSNTENEYTVTGNGSVTAVVDRMEVSPAFEITAPTTVQYGDSSYIISSNRTKVASASGGVATFGDGTRNVVQGMTLDINYVQNLHGQQFPWVGGAGKNLLDMTQWTSSSGVTFTVSGNRITIVANGTSSTYQSVNYGYTTDLKFSAGTYYVKYKVVSNTNTSVWSAIGFRNSSTLFQSPYKDLKTIGSVISYSITLTSDCYFSICVNSEESNRSATVVVEDIMISRTDSPFEPYENICPISGWQGANITVCGVNLINKNTLEQGSISMSTGKDIPATNRLRSSLIRVKPSTTYSLKIESNSGVQIYEVDKWKDGIQDTDTYNGWTTINDTSATFTSDADTHFIKVLFRYAGNTTIYPQDITNAYMTEGSTLNEAAYSGASYPFTWTDSGMVYVGTLDVLSGKLTAAWRGFDGGSVNWTKNIGQYTSFYCSPPQTLADERAEVCCKASCYKGLSYDNVLPNNDAYVWSRPTGGRTVAVKDTTKESLTGDEFKEEMTGQTFIYRLDTPQTIILTPQQVQTLMNWNNIYTDCGDVSVTYLAQDYSGQKLYLADLELPEGNNTLTIQSTGTTKITYANGRL